MTLHPKKNSFARLTGWFRGEDGGGSATMLILIPLLMIIVELAVFGGRIAGANGEVQSAVRQAAREASLSAGPGTAPARAAAVTQASLANTTFQCNGAPPTVATGNFVAGGTVTVTLTCTVNLSDLSSLPVPGTHTVTKSASEPIDPYRVIE